MKQPLRFIIKEKLMSERVKLDVNYTTPVMEELIVRKAPLQDPSQDECLREFELGGPNSNRDVRFVIDSHALETLLEVAKLSNTGRVILNRAGIKMKVKRARTGHIYETLHLVGLQPVPERAPTDLKIPTDEYTARQWIAWKGGVIV